MHITVCWLGKNIYNYNKDYYHLKSNNTLKTTKTAPFYCRELIYYIKSQNTNIPNLKNETKTIYKNNLGKCSQDHIIYGEQKWKEKTNLDFTKIWKNTCFSYSQPHTKDLLYKLLHYAIKTNNFI